MKMFLILVLFAASFREVRAEVLYSVAPVRVTAKGRLEITTGMRGTTLVYRLTRIDRENKGTFNEYLEDFFIDGEIVLRLSYLKGDRMIDCRNLGAGIITFYYRAQGLKAEKLLVGKNESSAEVYMLDENAIYRAVNDEDRAAILKALAATPDPLLPKMPNQRSEPTPVSVTTAAEAPVAPPAGAALP